MEKIRNYYSKDDFEISEHFIIAKFEYDQKAMAILGAENDTVNDTVNDTELEALNIIKENNKINELMTLCKKSRPTITITIKLLKDKRKIERICSEKL